MRKGSGLSQPGLGVIPGSDTYWLCNEDFEDFGLVSSLV